MHLIHKRLDKLLLLYGSKFSHSHKKGEDILETWTVVLIFSLELEISGVAVQSIHQNSEKWGLLLGNAQ